MGELINTGKLTGIAPHSLRVAPASLAVNDGTTLNSTYTQLNPRPGSAVSADDKATTDPQVHAAQGLPLELAVVRSGVADLDNAGIAYRVDGEDDPQYRGWNEPNLVSHWAPVEWTTTEDWEVLDAVTIPGNQKVVLIGHDTSGTVDNSVWIYNPEQRAWGARSTIATGLTDEAIALAIDGDSRILALFADPSGFGIAYFSDDDGATWDLHSEDILSPGANGNTVLRAGATFDRFGNVFWLLHTASIGLWQHYASRDGGGSFTKLDDALSQITAIYGVARAVNGDILVLVRDAVGPSLGLIRLTDAYDSFTDAYADIQTISNSNPESGAIWVDDDGMVYVVEHEDTTGPDERPTVWRSTDNGRTFTEYQKGLLDPDDEDGRVKFLAAAPSGGDALLLINGSATAASWQQSIGCLWVGGWESVEMPGFDDTVPVDPLPAARYTRQAYGEAPDNKSFIPFETFTLQGWVATGAAPTTDGDHHFSSVVAAQYVTYNAAHVANSIAHTRFEVTVDSGGATSSRAVSLAHRRADGTDDYEVEVRLATTGFALWDVHGITAIGSTVSEDLTTQMQFLLYWPTASTVILLYKRPADRAWTLGPGGSVTNDAATPNADDQWELGHRIITTAETHWGLIAWAQQVNTIQLLRGTVNTTNFESLKWGKALTTRHYPVGDQGDDVRRLRMSLQGSPARRGETYDVEPVYDYGIHAILPQVSPSPNEPWRSTGTADAVQITFDLTGAAYDTSLDGSWLWALYLGGCNIRQALLKGRAQAAGSWTTIGTWDASTGFSSLSYDLVGDQLRPRSVGAGGTPDGARYLHANEMVRGYAILDPGGTPKVRRILRNTPGFWTDEPNTVRPSFRLADIDGTEPASGTVHLYYTAGVLVVPQTDAAGNAIRRVQIEIPVQDVAEDFYQIGSICLGGVFALGKAPDCAEVRRFLPNTRVEITDAGTIFADERGPLAREITWSWTADPLNLYDIRRPPTSDYLAASGSTACLVGRDDVTDQLVGVHIGSKGGEIPVIAIGDVPSTATTITNRNDYLYGRLLTPIQATGVGPGDAERLNSITLQELVG